MRRVLIALAFIFGSIVTAHSQNITTGKVVPDLKIKQWLMDLRPDDADYTCVMFYHSESPQCHKYVSHIKSITKQASERINVIIITKEKYADAGVTLTEHLGGNVCVAFDDAGRSFRNFGIKFIPFCVIYNKKRIAQWCGHAGGLTPEILEKIVTIKDK